MGLNRRPTLPSFTPSRKRRTKPRPGAMLSFPQVCRMVSLASTCWASVAISSTRKGTGLPSRHLSGSLMMRERLPGRPRHQPCSPSPDQRSERAQGGLAEAQEDREKTSGKHQALARLGRSNSTGTSNQKDVAWKCLSNTTEYRHRSSPESDLEEDTTDD
ncbi:unnamed protein product [Coregonus sp. 'balchen']|nr:unnamed protein product [Coregonus sp. 'balchen']